MLHSIISFIVAFVCVFTVYYLFIRWYIEHRLVDNIMKAIESNIQSVSVELPPDENPLVSGNCEIINGNIVRKDDEADDDEEMTEDQLREYFWG